MKIRLFLLLFITFISSYAFSQSEGNVTLKTFSNKSSYTEKDTVKIALQIFIKKGLHINSYRTNDPDLIRTTISAKNENFIEAGQFFPEDKDLKFEFSSKLLKVYENSIIIGISLIPVQGIKPDKYNIPISVNYQACDDKQCYPPKTLKEDVTIEISSKTGEIKNENIFTGINFSSPTAIEQVKKTGTTKLTENVKTDSSQSDDQVSNWINEHGIFYALILIFLGGLALNLTPCVYPLIPITVSFFGAQVSGSKSQSVMMGVFYALGMSITYSCLGVFAALTGGLLGTALQNPIVIIFIALILAALGTSMFGLFEIKVPQKLALAGNKNRSGYFGSVLMGLTVGFIAAPCIGPFVLSLLVYVGKVGNVFTGFLMFFVLSLGLGVPYIFLAASSSSLSKLPRSGAWMEGVKVIFGLILFAMALNTLSPVFPKGLNQYILPVFFIASGIYLILIDKKGLNAKAFTKVKFAIGILAVIYGTWILKPAESGESVKWNNLSSVSQIDNSIKAAGKPTMIDFYADWCAQCKELDENTYTDKEIIDLSKKINPVKIDLTQENSEITNKFDIKGLPVVVFLNSKGEEIRELRVTGFLKPSEFKEKILKIIESDK
ncbi:protein-disulfide reductase DsbD [soil metagenome]